MITKAKFKQKIKQYSSIEPERVMEQITKDAESEYVGWRVVSLSIVNNEHGLYYGYVVYEKVTTNEID